MLQPKTSVGIFLLGSAYIFMVNIYILLYLAVRISILNL